MVLLSPYCPLTIVTVAVRDEVVLFALTVKVTEVDTLCWLIVFDAGLTESQSTLLVAVHETLDVTVVVEDEALYEPDNEVELTDMLGTKAD